MRIVILILLYLCFWGTINLRGQSAGDIDTLSQWRIDFYQADAYGVVYDHYKCYIQGDTIIDSNRYHKVYKSGYWYEWLFSGSISDDYYYSHAFAGCLREQDHIWYAISEFTGELDILYDFTIEVGDTVHGTGGQLVVTAIDTIMVNGEPKKQFILNDYWGAQYIIEDIGANSGLFEPMIFFENSSELHCYAIDFVPVWINPEGFDCDLSVNISEDNDYMLHLEVFPNPCTTSINFSYTLTEPCPVTITIFNPQGQLIEKIEQEQPKGEQQIRWNAEGLPAGMYYFRIQAGDKVGSGKMLKMR